MNQREAVIHVMEQNKGYATLGHLYQHVLSLPDVDWKTKTPFASIRRIVQNPKYFFCIVPGLWALITHKDSLPFSAKIKEGAPNNIREEFSHSYYQGLLVEIGNLSNYQTFVPAQDKNKNYLARKLDDVRSVKELHLFGYEHFVNIAKTVDVSWFNSRDMPQAFIEVEHTTAIFNSLIKFVELQDYCADFWIAAPEQRKTEFQEKLQRSAFETIKQRVQFFGYEKITKLHANLIQRKFEIGM